MSHARFSSSFSSIKRDVWHQAGSVSFITKLQARNALRGCLLSVLMRLVSNNPVLDSWVWPQLKCSFPPFHPPCLCSAPVSQSTAGIHTGQCWELPWQLLLLCSLRMEHPACFDRKVRPLEILFILGLPLPRSKYFLSAVPIIDRSHVTWQIPSKHEPVWMQKLIYSRICN